MLIQFPHVHSMICSSAARSLTGFLQCRSGPTHSTESNNALFCFNFDVVWTCNLSDVNIPLHGKGVIMIPCCYEEVKNT